MVQAQLLAKIAAAIGDGVVTVAEDRRPGGPSWRKGRLHVPGRGPRDTYGSGRFDRLAQCRRERLERLLKRLDASRIEKFRSTAQLGVWKRRLRFSPDGR